MFSVCIFPGTDSCPGALVDGVVDWHNGGHVGGGGVVAFALHGGVELGLRRIDPVAAGVVAGLCFVVCGRGYSFGGVGLPIVICRPRARNGGDFSVGAQTPRLLSRYLSVERWWCEWYTRYPLRLIEGEASQTSLMERFHVFEVLVLGK